MERRETRTAPEGLPLASSPPFTSPFVLVSETEWKFRNHANPRLNLKVFSARSSVASGSSLRIRVLLHFFMKCKNSHLFGSTIGKIDGGSCETQIQNQCIALIDDSCRHGCICLAFSAYLLITYIRTSVKSKEQWGHTKNICLWRRFMLLPLNGRVAKISSPQYSIETLQQSHPSVLVLKWKKYVKMYLPLFYMYMCLYAHM